MRQAWAQEEREVVRDVEAGRRDCVAPDDGGGLVVLPVGRFVGGEGGDV